MTANPWKHVAWKQLNEAKFTLTLQSCNITSGISTYMYIYSKSMKTQHLYFRYLSNIDLSIKSLFSSDNCILHMLSKDLSLY